MNKFPEHFYVPSKPTIIEGFRVMRTLFEKIVEAGGEKLDPAWYDDGPEQAPELYMDQPTLLKDTPTDGEAK